jgi:hypothetical protein
MKLKHDKQHRALEFTVGNSVWLRLNHHTVVSVWDAGPSKLAPKFFGPYQVLCWSVSGPWHTACSFHHAPAFTMSSMLSSCGDLKALLQLKSLRCHPLCTAEWCSNLHKCCAPGQLRHLGSCWSDGLIAPQQKLHGRHWSSSRSLTPSFSLRTSCFNRRGENVMNQCFGQQYGRRPGRKRQQMGPRPSKLISAE